MFEDKLDEQLFVKPRDGARMLDVSLQTFSGLLKSGVVPGIRLDGKTWRIPKRALQELAERSDRR
jgi:excisionase family DNA binding protein